MENKNFGMMIIVLVAGFALLLAACEQVPVYQPPVNNGNSPGTVLTQGGFSLLQVFDPTSDVKTKSFKTEAEFSDFINANAGSSNYYYGGTRGGGVMMEKALSSVSMDSAGSAPTAAPTMVNAEEGDFSTTNNQVSGVDEADIIKTDGEYIYSISGNTVYIIKAYPGEDAEIVSTIKFKERPSGLFINKDYLAVFGNYYDLDFFKEIDFKPRQGMTYFNIYSTKDKEEPELVKEYKFEGGYFQARMTGDYVYFVTTTRPEFRRDYPTPILMDGTVIRPMPVKDIYYFDIPYSSVQFANIHSINLEDLSESINSKSIAVESSQNMYMNDKSIYITYTEYINEWELRNKIIIEQMQDELTDTDKELIAKIKATDNEVLSQQEKESKILNIIYTYINFMDSDEQQTFNDQTEELLQAKLEEYDYMEYTIINKVGVSEGEITVKANGKVPGHVNNQFSMDEEDDVLRIATTISQRWAYYNQESKSTESENHIYTLDDDLEVLDSLTGIAKTEMIQSTRFMGNRLYMVTFRQVDPFFVFDLSNPKDIKELGKLKVPGFSRYLHPYDENTIIGIGRDASTTGQTRGLKISLFDVSDVENPKEIAKFVTEEKYAQSTAEYEHKAFLFSKKNDLLVIPAYSMTYRNCYGINCNYESLENYNGAFVFKVTKDSITMRGIIDHSLGSKNQYYSPLVERSLYIQDLLYTKSQGLLRINNLDDLSKVKNIEFTNEGSPYPVY